MRMALALNNLKRVDMPLNKETKPNQNKTTRILMSFPSRFFSGRFIKVQMVQPYSSTDIATGLEEFTFNREIRFPYGR